MSTPPEQRPPYRPRDPAEPATRPLRPAEHYAPRRYATDPYVEDRAGVAATFWTLESLRNAIAVVGLIAVVALGLAVWALLRKDTDQPTSHPAPATAAAITTLTARVNHLDAAVHSLSFSHGAQTTTTQSLTAQINALRQTQRRLAAQIARAATASQVSQLSSRVAALSGHGTTGQLAQLEGHAASLSSQLAQLEGRVASLASQVSQLKTQTTNTGTSTGP